ncbi:uncharacterized protein LOC114933899 [Nylanderia fulva]|uniref:uncharacterized protein LOC114933899 n=1 Tax=Nylanderia fulva TaxID=613905 RepID=UPI0010FACEE7|nr:uncharacterized protein LOC114933899 [Nylanderia fulva]
MKGLYLIAIAFLVQTVIAVNEINETSFVAADACPARDTYPPKLIVAKGCTQYYECSKGQKVLKDCEEGLHFSQTWNGCVKPAISDCDDDNDDDDDDECDDDILYPHECKCYKFYECKNNRKILHECKSGHYFDENEQRCVPGKNCKPNPKPECKPDGKYFPHECKCTKYYVCKNGRKVLRECKKGYHFDKYSSKCKKGACCPPSVCTDGEKKKHECSCANYYRCKNNEWVLKNCTKNQNFDPDLQTCTAKEVPGCKPPPLKPGACSEDDSTKWSHECDCRLYYKCKNKKKTIQECDWGKYFDDENEICKIASTVKCENDWDNWV